MAKCRRHQVALTHHFGLREQGQDARCYLGPEFHDRVESTRVALRVIGHVYLLAVHRPQLCVPKSLFYRLFCRPQKIKIKLTSNIILGRV